ncbi:MULTISPECIES: ABC transporter ATP-binding protein [Brochothrix]|uniref:ABC transporter ATP-binding protein n=2 Tax=Brochothrix thermosphacta TaxID=2756 RepID=A0A1D2LPR8_BROTH|nr:MULTISPECIES: ABC transporter ATP-binding protein [Brochothrix]SLN02351.1 ABC transporter, ATP-binding protein [Brachybacterium faecium]ANZ95615.1 ABC transporter ATP-binding protein [Brochothrix thermosphacta]ANZ98341.1 ABC transporter ATP-binding protein [Brochothrix thermosphacta]ATF25540.1 ABC transporter ATP-binding protein [Brochothrix thermosphacta]ATH84873.1 ABC transporter ATP-binding protein [Brochothrix thermosphacta]
MELQNVLEMNHIAKEFGNRTALKDISINIKRGEILGFLGPSGAGKTTTIKILTGQLKQTSGTAILLGKDTREINESIYEQIGIVTDNSGLYEKLSVYDNLHYFAKLLNVETKRIDQVLQRVGLLEDKKKPTGKLSKGMKQRLVLARAILHQPKMLFLDEPTSGLDPSTASEIHELLLELRDQGTAIFLTTHNMEEATKLCDNVALLFQGEIVESGKPKEVCLKYNTSKAYKVLLNDGTQVELQNTKEDMQKLTDWLSADEVMTLHSTEPTLETVFLTVTGRELQ